MPVLILQGAVSGEANKIMATAHVMSGYVATGSIAGSLIPWSRIDELRSVVPEAGIRGRDKSYIP